MRHEKLGDRAFLVLKKGSATSVDTCYGGVACNNCKPDINPATSVGCCHVTLFLLDEQLTADAKTQRRRSHKGTLCRVPVALLSLARVKSARCRRRRWQTAPCHVEPDTCHFRLARSS